jgi:L-glutamine-phosphate cytidylyltransferase
MRTPGRSVTLKGRLLLQRAIILAAGRGSRLQDYTADRPKCLLPFGRKTLLQHQLAAFAAHGIHDFHVVRGYCGEKINYPHITYHENTGFENNNILNSLFCAESALKGPVIVSYGDILFEADVVSELLKSEHNIAIAVDSDWHAHYTDRVDHPVSEAEVVVMDNRRKVAQIGKLLPKAQVVHGEFIGMLKLTASGAELLKWHFHTARTKFWDKPFQRAPTFQKAYLTDLLQNMLDLGTAIYGVIIKQGWKEIDTVEDYKKALTAMGADAL